MRVCISNSELSGRVFKLDHSEGQRFIGELTVRPIAVILVWRILKEGADFKSAKNQQLCLFVFRSIGSAGDARESGCLCRHAPLEDKRVYNVLLGKVTADLR